MNPGVLLHQFAAWAEADLEGHQDVPVQVRELIFDSRHYIPSEGVLFIALKGNRIQGRDFIPSLYERGCRMFLCDRVPEGIFAGAAFLVHPDPIKALQNVAARYRSHFYFPLIGITGSNGKTVVKEWLYQLLNEDYQIVRSPKSYNSQLGVPLSLWAMNHDHNLGIFEAGISKPGEMEYLHKMIKPDISIFTHFGPAHDDQFVNQQQKLVEKCKLFSNSSVLIYGQDYTPLKDELSRLNPSARHITWSAQGKADVMLTRVRKFEKQSRIQVIFENRFFEYTIPFTDEASIENSLTCLCLLLYLHIDQETIMRRMQNLIPVAMRLEMKQGINNCIVINDSYNSDPESLRVALEMLARQENPPGKSIVLSDFILKGSDEAVVYQTVARLLSSQKLDKIALIGPRLHAYLGLFPAHTKHYESTQQFLAEHKPGYFRDDVVLLKGARQFGLEQIAALLQKKTHETILEINLDAVANNALVYRRMLLPGVRVMAVVKALGYGSGSIEIARTLQERSADYLAVAYADEGVDLRHAGIRLPIMVMSPSPADFETMFEYRLEPEIYSLRILRALLDSFIQSGRDIEEVPIHIKLNTGMNRLGFDAVDIPELIRLILSNRRIRIASIFSHLAASEQPAYHEQTLEQIKRFEGMADEISEFFSYKILRHILNSGGIKNYPSAQFDMVRLGIGLHGIGDASLGLMPVAKLRTVVTQVRNIESGQTVGYSFAGRVTQPSRIATVPIGYADGYARKLGNGKGWMFINKKPVPTIGSICMDMTMLDVTEVEVNEGDEVIVFGPEFPVDRLAELMDTIPYEVLASISSRVKRVYYHE